jgi:hypothetical protein
LCLVGHDDLESTPRGESESRDRRLTSRGHMQRNGRLAAILWADADGHWRVMGLDEGGTLFRLNALQREPIDPTIASSHSISEGKDCPIESLGLDARRADG